VQEHTAVRHQPLQLVLQTQEGRERQGRGREEGGKGREEDGAMHKDWMLSDNM